MPKKPPSPPAMPEQQNRLTITDYDKSFLQPIIGKLKVGQSCTLTVTGEVTRLEERDDVGGGYVCELSMEPTAVKQSGGGGGTMASQMKSIQKKKAGYDEDVEDDAEDEDY